MGAMNSYNLSAAALAAQRAADELKKQREGSEPPWQRQWWVDLYTAQDNTVWIRARLADLRTEAPMIRTVDGWRIGRWSPFAPQKMVLKAAQKVIKKNLS